MELLKKRTNFNDNKYFSHYINIIVENRRNLIMVALFAFGMLLGASIIKDSTSSVTVKLVELFDRYRELRGHQSIISNFCGSMLTSLIFMSVTFIFGLCSIGVPLIGVVPVIRGLGLGMISGHLYSAYALNGLGYSLLVLYPGCLISILALLMCCNESVLMSQDMFAFMMNKPTKNQSSIKMYCARYLVILIISAIGAATDAVCLLAFERFFEF
jgi:hypothetical protein